MERKPHDPLLDGGIREHEHIAVWHANKSPESIRGDSVAVCFGRGPAVNYSKHTARRLAEKLENRDLSSIDWAGKVDDLDSLASDLRELADKIDD